VSSIEQKIIGDDFIWNKGVIEPADTYMDFQIAYILKFSSYGDYNSMSVFNMRSNSGYNFFIQIHVSTTNAESETKSNSNILLPITHAFLLDFPITYEGGDYQKDCYTSTLIFGGYLELIDSNMNPIDL
jgi:hypothetical protein